MLETCCEQNFLNPTTIFRWNSLSCFFLWDGKFFVKKLGVLFLLVAPKVPWVAEDIAQQAINKIYLGYHWEDYCFKWKMRTLYFIRWYLKLFILFLKFFIVGIIYKWLPLFYTSTKQVFWTIHYKVRAPWQKYVWGLYLKRHARKFNNLWQPKYRKFESDYIQPRIWQFFRWYAFKFRVNKKAFF